MGTTLFNDIIFGPVKSRRLGLSLGVNLLPLTSKLCNFNCIYCECGWTGEQAGGRARFNDRDAVSEGLAAKLNEMVAGGTPPDVITFAGNGEPTMHPDFAAIIDDTIALRDKLCPQAKISVLSNATMLGRASVREALRKVDNNILKLDSAIDSTVRLIDGPQGRYTVRETVDRMKEFNGRLIIQTMFLRGCYAGQPVDNTTEQELVPWLEAVKEIAPSKVMIYTIDRDTPAEDLRKVPLEDLSRIAARVGELGIECTVSG